MQVPPELAVMVVWVICGCTAAVSVAVAVFWARSGWLQVTVTVAAAGTSIAMDTVRSARSWRFDSVATAAAVERFGHCCSEVLVF